MNIGTRLASVRLNASDLTRDCSEVAMRRVNATMSSGGSGGRVGGEDTDFRISS